MDDKQRRIELAHFLRTRRERLLPEQFHLPAGAKRRRTPGLRREELAQVAGISLTWYTKLEQRQEIQVSAQVLEGLAQALQLTESERAHLYVLAREQLPLPVQEHTTKIDGDLQEMLDAVNPYPTFVVNERWDIAGWNRAAAQVFIDYSKLAEWERNLIWIMFTQPDQRRLYTDWENWARATMALFRASSGRYGDEARFFERRDRLMQVSSEFREWWQRHDIEDAHTGNKDLNHPLVGKLVLRSTMLLVANDPSLKMFLYTPLAEADTKEKLQWLTSAMQLESCENFSNATFIPQEK